MFKLIAHILIAAGAAYLVSGCTSTQEKVSCAQRDWYETGRQDGAQGATLDRLAKHRVECGHEFNSSWESLYTNGRNAGLVEFCAPENAYQMGRMGIAYLYVCPSTVEEQFLTSYRKGQEFRQLEVSNRKRRAQNEKNQDQMSN